MHKFTQNTMLFCILIVGCIIPQFLYAEKMIFPKQQENRLRTKHHPMETLLSSEKGAMFTNETKSRADNYNKLLVLLVDFQEDSDPLTTGNGKFLTEADSTYPITLGSPPHDREYYEYEIESVKYYYKAASLNLYDLHYEVYPKNHQAYTLPHPMSYYNPLNAPNELFVERVEEYFTDIFAAADADSAIHFADYAHYMVVHAGSDWQHDVKGDSPCDIPSFFIHVGSGKEAIVDNGSLKISHLCNVPETITQDINESNGYIYGYGVVNSVFAHEFGHSLGLVDLYNTRNNSSQVGVFDIMDNGGAGSLLAGVNNNISVEGALPTLPGAWSRSILFGNDFRRNGYLVDLPEIPLGTQLPVSAAEKKPGTGTVVPYIYHIQLSDDDELYIENRSTDPDGDGGTAVHGALNGRVILYPTAYAGTGEIPTFEYGYLLPSWQDADLNSYGGGLLVWQANNKILYKEGITEGNGTFVSNFDNNTVNIHHANRGIRILEADGIDDIGVPESWYSTGTVWEPFFKYRPILDDKGIWTGWSTEIFNDSLTAETKPSLRLQDNTPSMYQIVNISPISSIMRFVLKNNMFDKTTHIATNDTIAIIGPTIEEASHVLSFSWITKSTFSTALHQYDEDNDIDDWQTQDTPLVDGEQIPNYSISGDVDSDQNEETLIVANKKLIIHLSGSTRALAYSTAIQEKPLIVAGPHSDLLAVSTNDSLFIYEDLVINDKIALSHSHCVAVSDSELYITSSNSLFSYHINSKMLSKLTSLPEEMNVFHSVFYKDSNPDYSTLVMMSDKGDIYTWNQQRLNNVFQNYELVKPTQVALLFETDRQVYMYFGIANKVYKIALDGSIYSNFPVTYEGITFAPEKDLRIINKEGDYIIWVPVQNGGYWAIDMIGKKQVEKSLFWNKSTMESALSWEPLSHRLYWVYAGTEQDVTIASTRFETETDPILFNDYRKMSPFVSGTIQPIVSTNPLSAYAYPNPSKQYVQFHIEGATTAIKLRIYDITGIKVTEQQISQGTNRSKTVSLDVGKMGSGVYLYTIEANGQKLKKRFVVEK